MNCEDEELNVTLAQLYTQLAERGMDIIVESHGLNLKIDIPWSALSELFITSSDRTLMFQSWVISSIQPSVLNNTIKAAFDANRSGSLGTFYYNPLGESITYRYSIRFEDASDLTADLVMDLVRMVCDEITNLCPPIIKVCGGIDY